MLSHLNMASTGNAGQWRLIFAAAGVSGVLAMLIDSAGHRLFRTEEASGIGHGRIPPRRRRRRCTRQLANRGLRARDQAEELARFLLDDLRDELYQLGRSDLLLAATERAVAYFDHLPPELVTHESQAKHASVLLTLSDAHYQQGDFAAAIATARRSIALWKLAAAAFDPDGERTIRVGRAMGELALYQYQSDDPYAARQTYDEMKRLYESAGDRIKDAGWRTHGLAKVHLGLGEIERKAKRYPEARREFSETIRHITTAISHRPDELSWVQLLMTAHNNLGVVAMHEKNYALAEDSFVQAIEPNRALIRREPRNRRWEKELATTLQNLGALKHQQKEYARAAPYLREALALRRGVVDWDPKSARAVRKLAHSYHRMTLLQFDTGDYSNAVVSARQSIGSLHRLVILDPDDDLTLDELVEYTGKYRERLTKAGMPDAARQLIDENVSFAEANRGGQTRLPGRARVGQVAGEPSEGVAVQ
jgi:tetratricopeptide (TPR) repeat protein